MERLSSYMQEFGTGLPASRLGIGPLLRCSRTAKGRVHRVRSGIAELGTEEDKGTGSRRGQRRADATERAMGTESLGTGEKAWGMQSEGLAVSEECKAIMHNYAVQCMDIHRLRRA